MIAKRALTPLAGPMAGLLRRGRGRARVPHALSAWLWPCPDLHEPLAGVLRELNQQVVSFDPPGMFNTRRAAQVGMPEILA